MEQNTKKIILIVIATLAGILLVAGAVWLWIYYVPYDTYENSQFKFQVKYPREWQKAEGYAGSVVTFVRPKQTALDVVQPNFNISVQEVPAHIATLKSFSETITKQMIAIFDKNMQIVEDKDFTFGNRQGHRLIIDAPQPQNMKAIFVWTIKGSLAYIFTYMSKIDQYKELAPTVNQMVSSFEFK